MLGRLGIFWRSHRVTSIFAGIFEPVVRPQPTPLLVKRQHEKFWIGCSHIWGVLQYVSLRPSDHAELPSACAGLRKVWRDQDTLVEVQCGWHQVSVQQVTP